MIRVKEYKSRNLHLVRGFTIIELLIVIGIIGLLSAVVLYGLSSFRASGRDARRISDLRLVQEYLDSYFAKCGYYPGSANGGANHVAGTPTACALASDPPGQSGLTWRNLNTALAGSDLGIPLAYRIGNTSFVLPVDPLFKPGCPGCYPNYRYTHDNTFGRYLLWAQLEDATNPVLQEDLDGPQNEFLDVANGNQPLDCGTDSMPPVFLDTIYCVGLGG